ncbi:MurT ligase domain-containing protein [Actinomadura yumaensis]|uniref:Lipid II isoglutaminyl synthase (glutamine-hydrolyzing) subunit MurT n=1 Tax=Actinomadura yumaensis TaxID=111807 RepID=A0ABW2CGJ5_9ACTN
MPRLSVRTQLALLTGTMASYLYRKTSRAGAGTVLGRTALALAPNALRELTGPLHVVLVSGTNGKTTTTRLIAAILAGEGGAVSNATGANMPAGIVNALAGRGRTARYSVLEVDERYLPGLRDETRADTVVLLNLSRDQLDRSPETFLIAKRWREALGRAPRTTVVANCNDAQVCWAASAARHVVWVAVEGRWERDSRWCPACRGLLDHPPGGAWRCDGCGLERPAPDWALVGDRLVSGRTDEATAIGLALPGRINVSNAAMALATAASLGVAPAAGSVRLRDVRSVAGRYEIVDVAGRRVRLLLAKNPASWAETFCVVRGAAAVLLVLNARQLDGRDTSWIWDVDFAALRGSAVFVAGERHLDLAVRLDLNGIAFTVVSSLREACAAAPPGLLEVVANYTGFLDLVRAIREEAVGA